MNQLKELFAKLYRQEISVSEAMIEYQKLDTEFIVTDEMLENFRRMIAENPEIIRRALSE